MKINSEKYYPWILLLVGGLIFITHLDVIYVNIMEARNFITAREMVHQDNWLLTTMNAEPRYEKPPLPTWLTALSAMILGFDSLFGMRLPAALVTLLLMLFFYRLAPKTGMNRKQSFLATLLLSTSFYIVFMGRNGQWDIFTHSFMLGAIYFLWNLLSQNRHLWRNAIFGGLFFGFSILSKGPVSPYALLLPFLIAYGKVFTFTSLRSKFGPLLTFGVLGLIIGGWWFLYVRVMDPVPFVEIASKEAGRWTHYNVRPFYYYWSFFTQSGLWTIPAFVALLYPYLKTRVSDKKGYRFALWWTLTSVVLLSLIPEKKSRYLLPVLIPMALNTSYYIEYLFRKFQHLPIRETWIVYFHHGLVALLGIAFPIAGYFLLELSGHWGWFVLSAMVLPLLGMAMGYYLIKKNYPKTFYLSVAFLCCVIVLAFPLANAFLKNPTFRHLSELQEKSENDGFQVYEHHAESPELIWAYGEPIPELDPQDLPDETIFGVLLREKDSLWIDSLQPHYRIISTELYDMNYVHPKKDGYKERLIRKFYLLEKKENTD